MRHRWKTSGEFQHFNAKVTLDETNDYYEEEFSQSSDDVKVA